jgi:death-on-curing protein
LLQIHDRSLAEYGGAGGLRDPAALESAAAAPQQVVFGVESYASMAAKAAAYCYFLCCNHPFVDGNKRTALSAALTFLSMNACRYNYGHDEFYDAVLATAAGEFTKEALTSFFEHGLAAEDRSRR